MHCCLLKSVAVKDAFRTLPLPANTKWSGQPVDVLLLVVTVVVVVVVVVVILIDSKSKCAPRLSPRTST